MKNLLKSFTLVFFFLCLSCKEEDIQIEEVLDCNLRTGPGVWSMCLAGPEVVAPGGTCDYIFKISKRTDGENINEVVNWSVESGEMEIVDIETEVKADFTASIATLKFQNNFTYGVIKASSDRYKVDSSPDSSNSIIKYPISSE
jgi:hypothetical protein